MQALADQQEIMGALADIIIQTYAMECCVLRARKMVEQNGESASSLSVAFAQVCLSDGMQKIEAAARKVIVAVAEGDMLRTQLAILRRLGKYDPVDTIALRRKIAGRVQEAGKYVAI